jgi:uncharacterized paraquat-inducible protein A
MTAAAPPQARTTIWASCHVHTSGPAALCTECQTASDVNKRNKARCPGCRRFLRMTTQWGVLACITERRAALVSEVVVSR